jgi:hypothetical protein
VSNLAGLNYGGFSAQLVVRVMFALGRCVIVTRRNGSEQQSPVNQMHLFGKFKYISTVDRIIRVGAIAWASRTHLLCMGGNDCVR